MLQSLFIQNYALIEKLDIRFMSGFSVITGETGAGKSIILGAIGLLLGQRADVKSLRTGASKCIIEARFDVSAYGMQPFFAVITSYSIHYTKLYDIRLPTATFWPSTSPVASWLSVTRNTSSSRSSIPKYRGTTCSMKRAFGGCTTGRAAIVRLNFTCACCPLPWGIWPTVAVLLPC